MRAITFAFTIAFAVATPASAVEITTCNQTVPPGDRADLAADLTGCAGVPAIVLGDGAKLFLNGYTIGSGQVGVSCGRRCTVIGPGEITGVTDEAIRLPPQPHSKLRVEDVSIHDNGGKSIDVPGTGESGKGGLVRVANVSITNNEHGIFAWKGTVTARDSVISDNSAGAISGVKRFKLRNVTAQHNGFSGVSALWGTGVVVDSSIILNGEFSQNVDIAAVKLPKVVDSGCTHSAQIVSGIVRPDLPWGVCGAD